MAALAAFAIGALVGWLASFALRSSTSSEALPLVLAGAVGSVLGVAGARAIGWDSPAAIVGWVAVTAAAASVVLVEGVRLLWGSPGD
jgi:uncharacterized membrane protein YeaQ/YmgE (transglycosylase-associated protein family)